MVFFSCVPRLPTLFFVINGAIHYLIAVLCLFRQVLNKQNQTTIKGNKTLAGIHVKRRMETMRVIFYRCKMVLLKRINEF